jgi:hypothetical protein
LGKDTEEVALPPVEHVETDGDIVEVDLAPDPVHPPPPPRGSARKTAARLEPHSDPKAAVASGPVGSGRSGL